LYQTGKSVISAALLSCAHVCGHVFSLSHVYEVKSRHVFSLSHVYEVKSRHVFV